MLCPTLVLSSSRRNPQNPGFWNTHRPSNLCFKKSNNAFCIMSVTCNWASNKLGYNKNITNYNKTILFPRLLKDGGFPFGKSSMCEIATFSGCWIMIQWLLKRQSSPNLSWCFSDNTWHLKWFQALCIWYCFPRLSKLKLAKPPEQQP